MCPRRAFPSPIQWEDADPHSYGSGHKGASLHSPSCSPSPQIRGQKRPWVGNNFSILMPSFAAWHLQDPHEEAGSFPFLELTPLPPSPSHVQDEPHPTQLAQRDPLGSDSKSLGIRCDEHPSKEGAWGGGSRAWPCPGTQLGLPREGQSQRQGRALRDISPNVSFWCQSTGTASVAVQAVEPRCWIAEAAGFGAVSRRSPSVCAPASLPGSPPGPPAWGCFSARSFRSFLLGTEAVATSRSA